MLTKDCGIRSPVSSSSSASGRYCAFPIHRMSQVRKYTTTQCAFQCQARRFQVFGHTACCEGHRDHATTFRTMISDSHRSWKKPVGCPHHTWTKTVEADGHPLNFGLYMTWRRTQNRDSWLRGMEMATLQRRVCLS